MDLLTSIGTRRSIAAAAREIGLTYKAAWDAVETMNNLAGAPLVARSVGGRGGGGAVLTAQGRKLVATYQAVSRQNQRFLESVNQRVAGSESDLQLIRRMGLVTSARNQLAGVVKRIDRGAVNDAVQLKLAGGENLTAVITRESVAALALETGTQAVALIKASSVFIAAGDAAGIVMSARNQLEGKVQRVTRGAVNSEVVLEIAAGATIAAIITNAALRELKLARGRRATAIFKASSVILAVAS